MSQAHPAERVPRAAARRTASSSARSIAIAVAHLRAARLRQHRDPRRRAARPAAPRAARSTRRSTSCAGCRPTDAGERHRAGPALRPHRAVRPLRARERRPAGVPVPALPDPAGLARRAAAGGPLPPVHPGRHRHRRHGRAAVPPRRRGGAGDGARRSARCRCRPSRFQVNNRKLIQGFYRGLGIPDVTAAIRHDRQARQAAGRRRSRDLLVDDAGADRRAGRAVPRAGRRSASPTRSFVERVRALGVERRAARRRASPSWPRCVEGCADRASATASTVEANLRIARGPRLLHRHRRRDLHGRLRAAEVGRRRRPLRRARLRRPHDVPRASASRSASPARWCR